MPELVDPLPSSTRAALLAAVLGHACSERRRRHPTLVHLGRPGGRELVVTDPGSTDHALRTDTLAALWRRHRRDGERAGAPGAVGASDEAWLWLTRMGPLDTQDVDLAWLGAARTATAEAGHDLTMVVVTRSGWRDPRSDLAQTWTRVRR